MLAAVSAVFATLVARARAFLFMLLAAAVLVPAAANAQVFFSNTRIGAVTQSHSTVGTAAAAAISPTSVASSLLSWKICNDAVNSSTYLFVGKATDPSTDGVQLAPGGCFTCPNCTAATLKAVKLKAQAASNGYSIAQYKQQ